jgi:hypothetical protein
MSMAEDALLNGDICMGCGEWLGDGDGIPRLCPECDLDGEPARERSIGGRHSKRPVSIKHLGENHE